MLFVVRFYNSNKIREWVLINFVFVKIVSLLEKNACTVKKKKKNITPTNSGTNNRMKKI